MKMIVKNFTARNMNDVADHFEAMAAEAEEKAKQYRQARAADRERVRAEAFRECAAVARATELAPEQPATGKK